MRTFILLFLIVGFMLSSGYAQTPPPPNAQAPGLSVSASVGFGGFVKIGRWSPLFVTVTHRGEPTSVEIRVEFSVGMETTTTLIKRDKLAGTARKMYVLYLRPNAYTDEIRVTARAGGRTATHIVHTEVVNQREPLVVILSDSRAGQNMIVRANFRYGYMPWGSSQTQIVYADPRLLPDRWYGYHGVDLLMFSDISPRSISSDAAKTIEQWVSGGGKLAVFGGVQGTVWKGTEVEKLLPVTIGEGTRVVRLPREFVTRYGSEMRSQPTAGGGIMFQPVFNESGEIRDSVVVTESHLKKNMGIALNVGDMSPTRFYMSPRGDALVDTVGDLPLVAGRRWGRGTVGFIAFDDWHAPVKDWVGLKNLIAQMLGWDFGNPQPYNPIYYIEAEEMGYFYQPIAQAVADVPAMEVPPRKRVALLLLAYVTLLGPLHFFLSRKTRRLFAWVTFPLTIALFSGAAYRVGRSIKGQHVLVNEIALTETFADCPVAHTRSLFGVLSPDSTTYAIAAADDRTILSRPPAAWGLNSMNVSFAKRKTAPPLIPPYVMWGGGSQRQREEASATFDETDTLALKDVRIKWGTMELFRSESLDDLGKGIRARLTKDQRKNKLHGYIENGTPYDLEECLFLVGYGEVYTLARLPAHRKVTADKLEKYDWNKFRRAYPQYDYYYFYNSRNPNALKKLKPRERIMRAMSQFLAWWDNAPRFVGWVKKPVSHVAVRPRAFESRKWQLLVVRGLRVEQNTNGSIGQLVH